MTYNGWSNRASWSLALTISNDQELFEMLTEVLAPLAQNAAVDLLCELVTDHITNELEVAGISAMVKDLVSVALSQVDWWEVVRIFREDIDAAANK